jgi:hypothetical protein
MGNEKYIRMADDSDFATSDSIINSASCSVKKYGKRIRSLPYRDPSTVVQKDGQQAWAETIKILGATIDRKKQDIAQMRKEEHKLNRHIKVEERHLRALKRTLYMQERLSRLKALISQFRRR